jgi:hypothetical protein
MAVVGEEDLTVEVLGEEAVTQAVAVAVAVVVSAEPRTSQAGPRASEAEACASQAELACHRSDRTSLRGPAG